jgi:redox-sensitive bicupin YhaK (pirin superfamily)
MITLRKANERGHANHGWLDSHFTFSFAGYHDPNHVRFGTLRVINDDTVAPGAGFGTHPHNDMEIITYVLEGALEHKDSMGTTSVLRAGEVQKMTAGSGVTHSEYNHSKTDPLHLLQIWIFPDEKGLEPGYEEKEFSDDVKKSRLCPIVSPDRREGSLGIHQDAVVYASILDDNDTVEHAIAPGRRVWVHVARGNIRLNDIDLEGGDGAAVADETKITLSGNGRGEVLLFDLA